MSKKKEKILIADDEESIVIGLTALLEEEGYDVSSVMDGLKAFDELKRQNYALLLADLKMPGLDGLQILNKIKKSGIQTEVIIITGKGTILTAVKAMKAGAYDYLTKPVQPDRLRSIIPKALEHYRLLISHKNLEQQIKQLTHYEDLIGQSSKMLDVYRIIDAVADSTANVIITGESGTGKELVARAIHKKSGRKSQPFVAINVSALPEQILENELFGHEKGAFTGAISEKPGCFELANKGTFFLDEIGEMAMEMQTKLLRVLEEQRFRRLGGKKEIEVDVRVIAATNIILKQALEEKKLREDLYFRLCVVEIDLPPLRQRLDDVPILIEEFLNFFNQKNNKNIEGLTQRCQQALMRYNWPGNVRELKNVIERAVLLTRTSKIDIDVLPERVVAATSEISDTFADMPEGEKAEGTVMAIPFGTKFDEVERRVLLETLKMVGNNKTKAAKVLGISLKTIHNKLRKYQHEEK